MAGARPGVGERLAGLGDELPVVALRVERQLEHSPGGGVADFAVGHHRPEPAVVAPAHPHGELAEAELGVGPAGGRLQGEPFVHVVVAGEDEVGAIVVEGLPQRLDGGPRSPLGAGAEAGMVGDGHRASGLVGGQDVSQPELLR